MSNNNIIGKIILTGIIISLLILSSIVAIYAFVIKDIDINKYISHQDNSYTSEEPVQTLYNNGSFSMGSGDETYTLTPVASYEISAKIVSIKTYNNDLGISPVDLCTVWGKIINDQYITYSQSNRQCSYRYNGKDSTDVSYIQSHVSNNHIIPANENISSIIKTIELNDIVTLRGYLVDVTKSNSNGKWIWKTSQTRYDTENGACEIIYVVDIKT